MSALRNIFIFLRYFNKIRKKHLTAKKSSAARQNKRYGLKMRETPYETAIALAKISEKLRDALLDAHYNIKFSFLGLPIYSKNKLHTPLKMHLKNFSILTFLFGGFYYCYHSITAKGAIIAVIYCLAFTFVTLLASSAVYAAIPYFLINAWLGFSFGYDYYRTHIRKIKFWI